MKRFDISQEVFSCKVYPGDPEPRGERILQIQNGDVCNLTAFSMCAHNGTHVDAPYHFLEEGKQVHQLSLEALVGECFVAEFDGELEASDAEKILAEASREDPCCSQRILIKGKAVVGPSAARRFAEAGVLLLGNESQTVGDENAPAEVHRILLGKGVILLEGVCLQSVKRGAYLLFAAPLKLEGADGAPCRAVLLDLKE